MCVAMLVDIHDRIQPKITNLECKKWLANYGISGIAWVHTRTNSVDTRVQGRFFRHIGIHD